MSRRKKDTGASGQGDTGRGVLRRLLAVALTLAAAGALVWGVAKLGDAARLGVGPRDRYAVRFADIACDPPPGMDRPSFLSEVRYVSNVPETFQSLDRELHAKLSAAFTAHPRVAAFDGVSVDAEGAVRVSLRFRTPALAVRLPDGTVRVVDASGVLLPPDAAPDGLPEVRGIGVPTVPAGQAWGEVKRALELADAHKPRTLEKSAKGWRLTTADGKQLAVEK